VAFAGDVSFRCHVVDGERRFLAQLNPKYGGFELTPPYAIRGRQRAGRTRAEHKQYG
jgi:hypothetical protein